MTDEVIVEGTEAPQEPQLSEVEQRAMDMGWMPKEQWVEAGKDPHKHRSAELYVELEPLFGKIDSLKKEVRSTKQTLETFKQHHARVRETEYKRALDDLKAQKRLALEEGDAASVVEIDEEIAETKAAVAKAQQEQVQEASQIHPDFAEWLTQNPWYASDRKMQAFADSYGKAYAVENEGVDPKEVLKEVEKQVKKAFPEKFKNPAQERPSGVEAPRTSGRRSEPKFELTENERRVMTKLVKSGALTEEQYIADLKKVRG